MNRVKRYFLAMLMCCKFLIVLPAAITFSAKPDLLSLTASHGQFRFHLFHTPKTQQVFPAFDYFTETFKVGRFSRTGLLNMTVNPEFSFSSTQLFYQEELISMVKKPPRFLLSANHKAISFGGIATVRQVEGTLLQGYVFQPAFIQNSPGGGALLLSRKSKYAYFWGSVALLHETEFIRRGREQYLEHKLQTDWYLFPAQRVFSGTIGFLVDWKKNISGGVFLQQMTGGLHLHSWIQFSHDTLRFFIYRIQQKQSMQLIVWKQEKLPEKVVKLGLSKQLTHLHLLFEFSNALFSLPRYAGEVQQRSTVFTGELKFSFGLIMRNTANIYWNRSGGRIAKQIFEIGLAKGILAFRAQGSVLHRANGAANFTDILLELSFPHVVLRLNGKQLVVHLVYSGSFADGDVEWKLKLGQGKLEIVLTGNVPSLR